MSEFCSVKIKNYNKESKDLFLVICVFFKDIQSIFNFVVKSITNLWQLNCRLRPVRRNATEFEFHADRITFWTACAFGKSKIATPASTVAWPKSSCFTFWYIAFSNFWVFVHVDIACSRYSSWPFQYQANCEVLQPKGFHIQSRWTNYCVKILKSFSDT